MAHLVGDQSVPWLPGLGLQSGDAVLHRQGVAAIDEGVHPCSVGVKHALGMGVHDLVVGLGAGLQPEPAHHLILAHRLLANGFRPAARPTAPVVLHVPQPVLGRDEPLCEEGVQLGFGLHVRYPEFIPEDFYSTI